MRCSTKSVWYLTWVLLCLDITYSSMNNRHFEGFKLWTVKMRTRAPFVDGVAAGYTGGRTNFHTSSLLAGASDAVRWSVKHLIWSTLSLSQVRFLGSNYFCPFWVSRNSFFFHLNSATCVDLYGQPNHRNEYWKCTLPQMNDEPLHFFQGKQLHVS